MKPRSEKDIYYNISIFTFVFFILVEFFGLSLPFQPPIQNVDQITNSNILNQIVYSLLFIFSLIVISAKYREVLDIIKKEKVLTIFLVWCILSILWSVDPVATFKRFFRTLTLFTVTLSLVVHTDSTEEILKYIKPALYLYVFLSLPVSILIPGAKDPQFHTFRGFTDQKNNLGQISVMCILLSYFLFKSENEFYKKSIAALSLLFSLALLFGSESMTSISSFLFVSGIGLILYIDNIYKPLGLGRSASVIIITFSIVLIVSIIFIAPIFVQDTFGLVGKNLTFTGRTGLWLAILANVSKHPILGAGYQAFWSLNNPAELELFKTFVWLPNEAHNGYLDILNDVGIIGFGLFFIMLVKYFVNIAKLKVYNPLKWIVIAALIINLQESTLFRPGHLVGDLVVLSYLLVIVQLKNQKLNSSDLKK